MNVSLKDEYNYIEGLHSIFRLYIRDLDWQQGIFYDIYKLRSYISERGLHAEKTFS